MKKRIVPQSIPTSTAHTTPISLAFHFLAISELIQDIELPNVVGFYVQKKCKTTERDTYGSKIVFAKTNKALHLFL